MVVEIMFTGLIAFVKGHCSVQATDTMQIVMVQGQMLPHKPRLIVDVRDVPPWEKGDAVPDEIIEVPGGTQLAVWNLDSKLVAVRDAGSKPAKAIRIVEGERRKIKDTEKYLNSYPKERFFRRDPSNDLSWASELHRACRIPGADPAKLVATGDVRDDTKLGEFGVARFAQLAVEQKSAPSGNTLETELGKVSKRDVYNFPKEEYGYKQVLADQARLKLGFDTSSMKIVLEDLRCDLSVPSSGTAPKATCEYPELTIRVKPSSKSGDVSISVSNLPSKKGEYASAGAHFHEYYKLLEYEDHDKCPTPDNPNLKLQNLETYAVQPIKCAICSTCGVP